MEWAGKLPVECWAGEVKRIGNADGIGCLPPMAFEAQQKHTILKIKKQTGSVKQQQKQQSNRRYNQWINL